MKSDDYKEMEREQLDVGTLDRSLTSDALATPLRRPHSS
jgi:hypothetical protein